MTMGFSGGGRSSRLPRSVRCLAQGGEQVASGFPCYGLPAFLVFVFDKLGGQLLQKRGRMTGHELAVFFPTAAMADRERLHRASNRDVKKPSLFIQRALGFRPQVRQQ